MCLGSQPLFYCPAVAVLNFNIFGGHKVQDMEEIFLLVKRTVSHHQSGNKKSICQIVEGR